VAGLFALAFICKLILARRVVWDELSSPTTATPAGLICMTLDIVFAGRGLIGQVVVSISSLVHLCLAIWFIYMALAYRKCYYDDKNFLTKKQRRHCRSLC
jgi:tellurite resistance protein TehA-like permease